jgi:DNA-binding IclR family transcriptional regulator
VTRAVAILRLLGRSEASLGVNAIARSLGLVPSTCLHILRVLVAEELVVFDPIGKRYRLGAGLVSLARSALAHDGFAQLAQPELDRLSRTHGVTAIGLAVMGIEHIVVVAISRWDDALRLHVDVGSRFPALISASGQCIAAFSGHSWAALAQSFGALRWDRPPAWSAWRAEVEAARVDGYAVDDGHHLRGVTVIAAPVRGTAGTLTHVLAVAGMSEQIRQIGVNALARELRAVADGLSDQPGVR